MERRKRIDWNRKKEKRKYVKERKHIHTNSKTHTCVYILSGVLYIRTQYQL